MNIVEAIKFLDKQIKNPSKGLPEELFFFTSRIVPLVNVDLLIKDENGRTLLSWRDDEAGKGWHVLGGIIRFKETFAERLLKVAKTEIGRSVKLILSPLLLTR